MFFARPALSVGIAAIIASAFSPCAPAAVRITDDHGGNIGEYWSRYVALRDSQQQVIVDGLCSSACTLVLGIVPRARVCLTRNALFGFHAAWQSGFFGQRVINEPATRTLMSFYPAPVRRWIAQNGGLGKSMIYMPGSDLIGLYRQCR